MLLRTKSNYETASLEMKMKHMAQSGFGLWKIVSLTITFVNKLVTPNCNKIYLNNFADNAEDNVDSYNSTNIWNSSEA